MEVRLPPEREAHLTALAAESGLSTEEVVEEALVLWEAHHARRGAVAGKTYSGTGRCPHPGIAEGK